MADILKGSTPIISRVFIRDSSTLAPKTGAATALAAGSFLSKNGGTGAAVAGTIAEVDSTKFPGLYSYTPTSTETNTFGDLNGSFGGTGCQTASVWLGTVVAVDPLIGIFDALVTAMTVAGSIGEQLAAPHFTVSSGVNTSVLFSTNLGTPTAGKYNGQFLCFLSGSLAGQSQQITSSDGTGNITMATAFTGAPSNTDRFIFIGK